MHSLTFAFKLTGRARIQAAVSFVLALPSLCAARLRSVSLWRSADGEILLCSPRLLQPSTHEVRERLMYWALRQGTSPDTSAEVAAANLAGGRDVVVRHVPPSGLPAALASLFGAEQLEEPEPLALALDLTGPERDGLVLDAERRTLFLPGLSAPPVGDELLLVVTAPGTVPLRTSAVVGEKREPGEPDPGLPAGFVLELTGASPDVLSALGQVISAPSPTTRREPRHVLRIPAALTTAVSDDPVRVKRLAVPLKYADRLENMSTGGALVRTSLPLSNGQAVWLHLPAGMDAVRIPAAVVHTSAGAAGLRFHVDSRGARLVAEVLAEHLTRSRQVLVVDDDPLVRRVLGDTLEEHGYEVLTAGDGLTALRTLSECVLGTMAVVTDVHMPVMGGLELVHRIREAGGERDLAIVAVTATPTTAAVALRMAGVDEIVGKELGPTAIVEAVDRVAWRAPTW